MFLSHLLIYWNVILYQYYSILHLCLHLVYLIYHILLSQHIYHISFYSFNLNLSQPICNQLNLLPYPQALSCCIALPRSFPTHIRHPASSVFTSGSPTFPATSHRTLSVTVYSSPRCFVTTEQPRCHSHLLLPHSPQWFVLEDASCSLNKGKYYLNLLYIPNNHSRNTYLRCDNILWNALQATITCFLRKKTKFNFSSESSCHISGEA